MACVLQLCHPMKQSPLLLGAQGSAVTSREQQCSQPHLLCRMGCLEVGLDLGSPTLHPVPTKTSTGLENTQELYGV